MTMAAAASVISENQRLAAINMVAAAPALMCRVIHLCGAKINSIESGETPWRNIGSG
jgi:hypothetical protein